jgi:hypothetical protein
MSNLVKGPLVRLFLVWITNIVGEEQNIEMEIMETGGKVAGLDLEGLGI